MIFRIFFNNKKPTQYLTISFFVKFSLISFVFVFIHSTYAKKQNHSIWIKAPQMPLEDFNIHLKALGPHHISYAQDRLKQVRDFSNSFQLKTKLITAQNFYLSGEGKKAKIIFQKITDLALEADWKKEDRRIILYSFLRLAQSEKNIEKRKALLLSACNFTSFQINKQNYSDYPLFPPPLMEELKLIQKNINKLSLIWTDLFPQHEIILINGKRIYKNKIKQIPQAFYRITALSSSHQDWSQNLNLSTLLTKKIKTTSLTKGVCDKLHLKSHIVTENTHIAISENCPQKNKLLFKTAQQQTHKKTSFIKEIFSSKSNLKLQKINAFHKASFLDSQEVYLNKELNLDKDSQISKIPPWLIIGLGVGILSLTISLNKQKNKHGKYTY